MENLIELIVYNWGEDIEDAEAYARIIAANVKPEKWEEVVTDDLFFNRYNSPTSYEELAGEILSDDCFCNEEDRAYLESIEKALNNNTVQEMLIAQNWRIDTEYGGAIGFADHILIEGEEK